MRPRQERSLGSAGDSSNSLTRAREGIQSEAVGRIPGLLVPSGRNRPRSFSMLDTQAQELATKVPLPGGQAVRLTEREREVLDLLLQGSSNERIARRLEIGVRTVKSHVRHVLVKCGCARRTQLHAAMASPSLVVGAFDPGGDREA